MTVLRQRCTIMLDLAGGGWLHRYDIIDGNRVVGVKSVHRPGRNCAVAVSYQLGDEVFLSAADFIAAYQERESTA